MNHFQRLNKVKKVKISFSHNTRKYQQTRTVQVRGTRIRPRRPTRQRCAASTAAGQQVCNGLAASHPYEGSSSLVDSLHRTLTKDPPSCSIVSFHLPIGTVCAGDLRVALSTKNTHFLRRSHSPCICQKRHPRLLSGRLFIGG